MTSNCHVWLFFLSDRHEDEVARRNWLLLFAFVILNCHIKHKEASNLCYLPLDPAGPLTSLGEAGLATLWVTLHYCCCIVETPPPLWHGDPRHRLSRPADLVSSVRADGLHVRARCKKEQNLLFRTRREGIWVLRDDNLVDCCSLRVSWYQMFVKRFNAIEW